MKEHFITYCISNDKVLAHDFSFSWPQLMRARFHELRGLYLKFGVLFDSFKCNLHMKSTSSGRLKAKKKKIRTIDCSRLTNRRTYYTSISI
jgi:hypothetical protein